MPRPDIAFIPSPDVKVLLNRLLDTFERRAVGQSAGTGARPARSIKIALGEAGLSQYYSQIDPEPRQLANEQLQTLESAGLLRLLWQPGEKGHLLDAVVLVAGSEADLYRLVKRTPVASLHHRLERLLLGERFRFDEGDWRYRAVQLLLERIKVGKSPAPFSLTATGFNEDLIAALTGLDQITEETPYRVFSVRTFNNSKRFDDLRPALVRLARLGNAEWKRLPEADLLREINLVANPTYLLLAGAWTLVDKEGQVLALGEFNPSVGLPAVQAAYLQRVNTRAGRVLCIENLTTFHSMSRNTANRSGANSASLLCLAGNPPPACRRLLQCLVNSLPESIPLQVWADLDYGGFNILAQLRKQVSPRFTPYSMDVETLDRYAQYARPLTQVDCRNLERLSKRAELNDVRPVIAYLLQRGLKLEQEAIPV